MNVYSNKIEINRKESCKSSKITVVLMLIFNVLLLGYFFHKFLNKKDYLYSEVFSYGIIAVLVVSLISRVISLFRKGKSSLVLTIDDDGITNNSPRADNFGFVAWEDVLQVRYKNDFLRGQFLLLMLSDNQKYLNQANLGQQKKMMRLNIARFRTPICINVNALEIDKYKLKHIIKSKLNQSKLKIN